jgi:AcrR family transcriptional regulator
VSIFDKQTKYVNTEEMDVKKRDKVLTAALNIFLRYGFKRVTMNDIAEAAGISRPALYLVFSSKEEIFKGVYEHWVKETLAEIESKIAPLKTPEEKLRAAFELWTVRPFEMMIASSEMTELLECAFEFAQDSVKQGYRSFEKILLPILKSHSKFQTGKTKVSVEKTAHILSSAVRGFKVAAKDAPEIRSMIKELLNLTLDD